MVLIVFIDLMIDCEATQSDSQRRVSVHPVCVRFIAASISAPSIILSVTCCPPLSSTGQVMLLGDSSVGKTCILVRFKDGAFLGGNFIATVGIDFRVRVSAAAATLDKDTFHWQFSPSLLFLQRHLI